MKNRLLLPLLTLLLPVSASALQVVDVVDGKTVPVTLSQKALNRIAMADGSRVEHIWAPQDRITLEADNDSGQLFIRTTGNQPFAMFVKADNGETYTLLAALKEIPSETVFLKPPRTRKPSTTIDKAMPYPKRIARIVKALGRGEIPDDMTPRQIERMVPLWQGVHLKHEMSYLGEQMTGEVYTLTHLGQGDTTLSETQFSHLPGGPVIAVAIEQRRLASRQTTQVIITRKPEPHP